MGGLITASTAVLALGVGFVQGGGLGGGGFGGGGGQQGGAQGPMSDRNVATMDAQINGYLNGDGVRSILTPGEFTEWPMTLKAGQVVIAEANSEAFDPALQVVDKDGKVLLENDDRYPGDQRPLLLWRCPADGEYKLRGRCFRDKAGGQMFLLMKTYETVDLGKEPVIESKIAKTERFLFRVPLKAGQIRLLSIDRPGNGTTGSANFLQAISPIGLPDVRLGSEIANLSQCVVMAPVDGDYYVLAQPYGPNGLTLRTRVRELVPRTLKREGDLGAVRVESGGPVLWSVPVKAGELLAVNAPELSLRANLIVAEQPDLSKYDLKKPENNPFFPKTKKTEEDKGPAFQSLDGRSRDPRVAVFAARRDATLWIATNGDAGTRKDFELTLGPAAKALPAAQECTGKLRIGNTDYWAFDAKVGEVMRFQTSADSFSAQINLLGPELDSVWSTGMGPDETLANGELIVQRPGRHLVAVSCLGDGGGGDYRLSRQVYVPKDLKIGTPVQGELETGQVHVWKLAAKPEEPMLVRWESADWTYTITVRDESGAMAPLPMTQIDSKNRFGILKVDRPRTLLIVLIPGQKKTSYAIEVSPLPGYKNAQGEPKTLSASGGRGGG